MQGRKLFDVVVVVALKQDQQKDKIKIVPYVKYHYPQSLSPEIEKSLLKPVTEFCFPDTTRFLPENYNWRKKVKSETFSFVLTEGSGDKRWGYCRMTIPGGCAKSPTDYPICFCVTSLVPCFNIFSQILNQMESQVGGETFDGCNSFLNALYTQPLPSPGGSLTAGGITLTRPNDSDSLLEHVNFEPLLRYLEADTILSIFASLLVERRVIFTADSLSTLSATVQAAVAVLYPFVWQHIFIPVLPQSLLSFCCAPMPFVVGILRSAIPELESMQRAGAVEEVIFVDIDKNKVSIPPGMDDAQLLPWSISEGLYRTIDNTAKAVKQKYSNFLVRGVRGVGRGAKPAPSQRKGEMSKVDTKDFANAFIGFMVDLLANYRNYITPNSDKKFDTEGFIKNKPSDLAQLLTLVGECQMFEMFIRERMNHPIQQKAGAKPGPPPGGKFEKRMSTYTGAKTGKGKPRPAPSSPSTPPPSAPGAGSGINGAKAPLTRFTMYEMGELSREDVTKSVAPLSSNVNGLKNSGNLSFSVDHGSFKKLASAEDLKSKETRERLGIQLDNENALTLLVGQGGRGNHDSLPAPPAPPGKSSPGGGSGGTPTRPPPAPPLPAKPVGESLAGALGEASHQISARLTSAASLARSLPKKTKNKMRPAPSPNVSSPQHVKKTSDTVESRTMRLEYAQQEVHPSRGPSEAAVRAGPRAEKAKSMSVVQVDRSNDATRSLGSLPSVKGRTAEWEKKDTQDVVKRWRAET